MKRNRLSVYFRVMALLSLVYGIGFPIVNLVAPEANMGYAVIGATLLGFGWATSWLWLTAERPDPYEKPIEDEVEK